MGKLEDLIGKTYGELLVIERVPNKNERTHWLCKCSCGNESEVSASNLKRGHTKTCGNCNKFEVVDSRTMKCILKNGECFIFDIEDYSIIKKHKWSIENIGYVHTMINKKHIRLHRHLMNYPKDLLIDHINGDRWDNRKENLRLVTNKQNCRNSKLNSRNTSGYKGVSFCKKRKKYEVSITVDGKKIFLGYYTDPIKAARAYDTAAIFHFKEFARINFVGGEVNERSKILELAN